MTSGSTSHNHRASKGLSNGRLSNRAATGSFKVSLAVVCRRRLGRRSRFLENLPHQSATESPPTMVSTLPDHERIVFTGIGLTAPNGNNLAEYRHALLTGRSGVRKYDIRYVGETLAGICDFDELRYQKKKEVRRGTRAGSIGIYCAQEAVADSGLDWANLDRERVGVYIGVTEHGNVETENEL